RVRPAAEAGRDPVESALVLVDTSASRALGFEAQIELLAKVAAGLGAAPLVVAAFDQGVDVVYEGPAAGFAQAGPARLRERQALGASNLEGALTWAKAKVHATRSRRVIVMTDGVPTMGAIDPAALRLAAEALKGAGVERLDALAVGGIRDDAQLKALCAAGLARDGVVIDGAKGAEQALRRLRLATRSVDVKVEGAEWQWPERLEGVQPGDEALVYAKLAPGASPKLVAGGAASEPKLANVDRPLLERAWVSAKIAQLVRKPPPGLSEEAARNEIVRLSTAFRVLSPHTALLVLETEQDYVRYKIDRKALADILAIDGTKLARQRRAEDAPVPVGAPGLKPAPVSDGVVLRAPPPPPGGAQPGGSPGEEGVVAPWGGGDGGIGTLARGSDGSTDTRASDEGAIGTLARGDEGGTGARAKGEEGSMGRSATAPAAEAPAAVGSLWGDEIGESFGVGGLGLRGIGEGGGGRSEGIGLGSIGGKQAGAGRGAGSSAGSGRLGGSHAANPVRIRPGAVEVNGRLPPQVIHRIVRQNFGRFRLCYEAALGRTPNLSGHMEARFVIARDGSVAVASGTGSTLADPTLVACVTRSLRDLTFPRPEGGIVSVVYPLSFTTGDAAAATPAGGPVSGVESSGLTAPPRPPPPARFGPYQGQLAEVMEALSKGEKAAALQKAIAFRAESPGDVLALVALGEAFEAAGETRSAARAYGSLIDLFSSRADLRRMAGERLERLDATYAHALAADSYDKAARQRPDHPSSHRLLAYARLRAGDPAGAFDAIEAGAKRTFPAGRFRGVERILREDAGLIGAAWANQNPAARGAIEQRLRALGAALEQGPSLRFVLNWETDANDVDFHIYDAQGGHAFFIQKQLPSGGELYDDVITGYGPECFTVRAAAGERAGAYRLRAHYYARGPMGYGMGKLEIIDHDGKGNLVFEQRPFVIMRDGAFVELGTYPAGAVVKATEETEGAEGAERPELPRP
ncbi:MAG TPA: AgmX/PglI C-terminal domain-containing protein, partial [Polyangiaceae bacterium]|nr:AgmX/PglI C-terminal domain-containing protein [Polyangiaceae bacterium]